MKKLLTFFGVLVLTIILCSVSVFAADGDNEARVGDTEYATLQEAIDAAGNGDTVTLLKDLTFESTLANAGNGVFNISKDDKITIDLNGKTINVTDNSTGNFIIFYNYGDLTIKNGTVNLTATVDRSWNAESAIVLSRGGYLTVESGSYNHLGGTSMAFALDISGNWYGDAYATVKGGSIQSSYIGVRRRMENVDNSACGVVYMSVTGGTISGGNAGIWGQNASSYSGEKKMGNLEVTGGTVSGGKNAINMATTVNNNLDVVVSGDAVIDGNLKGTASDFTINGGKFTVAPALSDSVVSVSNGTDTYYTSLQGALNSCKNGETVTLLSDITLTQDLVVPKTSCVVLDLAGYTISQVVECTQSYSMISNNGTLTITDSVGGGKISFTDTGVGDDTASWGSYTITTSGNLTVENVTIENLSEQNKDQASFKHTSLAIFQYSGSTTINSGIISTPYYRSVRLWSGDMTINGGTFDGQVWIHCVNNTSNMTINGGEFSPNGFDGSSVFVNNSGYVSELAVTGGTFATKIGANDINALAGAITGGTFSEKAIASMGEGSALFAEPLIKNEDGSYTVSVAIEDAFTFLGYSINAEGSAITAGYIVDHEIIALYCEQNGVTLNDFGVAFGIGTIIESTATSFAKYNKYSNYDAMIVGFDPENTAHTSAILAMAFYVDLGMGKQYVIENANGEIELVAYDMVPTTSFDEQTSK